MDTFIHTLGSGPQCWSFQPSLFAFICLLELGCRTRTPDHCMLAFSTSTDKHTVFTLMLLYQQMVSCATSLWPQTKRWWTCVGEASVVGVNSTLLLSLLTNKLWKCFLCFFLYTDLLKPLFVIIYDLSAQHILTDRINCEKLTIKLQLLNGSRVHPSIHFLYLLML